MKLISFDNFLSTNSHTRKMRLSTLNSHYVYLMFKYKWFSEVIKSGMICIDGVPLWFFLNIFNKNIPLNQGSSLNKNLGYHLNSYTNIEVVGGSNKTMDYIIKRYSPIGVVNQNSSLLSIEDANNCNITLLDDISEKKILYLIFLGAPKQDIFSKSIVDSYNNAFVRVLNLGGASEMWVGNLKPAPKIIKFLLLEFLWRLSQEITFYRIKKIIESFIGLALIPIFYFKYKKYLID